MDLLIADRYDLPREMVWYNRQAFEADLSLSFSSDEEDASRCQLVDQKTTEDLWNDLLAELDLQREGEKEFQSTFFL